MARILVIERDERVRDAIIKILESRGHEVLGVPDVAAATKGITSNPPALLVADFATLGAKRAESVTRLRAAAPGIPTIFIADSRGELLEASSSAAAEGAAMVLGLKKPLNRKALLDTIARAMAVHAAGIGTRSPRMRTQASTATTAGAAPRRSVLIVDADAASRQSVSRALEKAEYTVYAAADGNEGFELFSRHRPDVAVVEIVIPGKDGVTMIGEMRMLAPDTKIVAMSGADPSAPEANLSIAWMYGASRSLRKPFHMSDLLETIGELISEAGTQSSPMRLSQRPA